MYNQFEVKTMKNIYIVRHCKADGQQADANLTAVGQEQTKQLIEFFENRQIDAIYSSTYKRAYLSVEPLAKKRGLSIIQDERLTERVFSTIQMDDWMTWFKKGFENPDLVFEGGESGRDAKKRIVQVIEEIIKSDAENIIVASHGNLISMFLQTINEDFDFDDYWRISNPDVFLVTDSEEDQLSYERIWVEKNN
ncbi:histidine phosphatase family protein [Kurthia zopfii]|nr:histidine phosphatase family protein [Kurthia zopfii]